MLFLRFQPQSIACRCDHQVSTQPSLQPALPLSLVITASFRRREASNGKNKQQTVCQSRKTVPSKDASGAKSENTPASRRLSQILKLDLVHPPVEAAAGEQFLVPAHIEIRPPSITTIRLASDKTASRWVITIVVRCG